MEGKSQPVLAYAGPEAEVAFLGSLLTGSGIECSIDLPSYSPNLVRESRLFVAQTDMEAAAPLIEDFRKSGAKSSL